MYLRNIIILILFSISGYAQIEIQGKVLDKIKNSPLPNSRVTLSAFVRDSLIIADSSAYHPYRETYFDSIYTKHSQLMTDSTGYFRFVNLDPGVYKITAENLLIKTERYSYYEERENIICTVTNSDSGLNKNLYLSVFCPFDSTKSLKLCPRCGKDDELRIFVWGLPVFHPGDDEKKYIYTGDCSPPRCRPSFYCSRCKLEF